MCFCLRKKGNIKIRVKVISVFEFHGKMQTAQFYSLLIDTLIAILVDHQMIVRNQYSIRIIILLITIWLLLFLNIQKSRNNYLLFAAKGGSLGG